MYNMLIHPILQVYHPIALPLLKNAKEKTPKSFYLKNNLYSWKPAEIYLQHYSVNYLYLQSNSKGPDHVEKRRTTQFRLKFII